MFTSFKTNQNEINNTQELPDLPFSPLPRPATPLPTRNKYNLSLGNLNQYTYRVLHLDIIRIILS